MSRADDWQFDDDIEQGDDITIECRGAVIGQVYGYMSFPCFDPAEEGSAQRAHEESIATARRFAASEALLAACEAAWDFLGQHAANPAIGIPLRNAIDKATGRSRDAR